MNKHAKFLITVSLIMLFQAAGYSQEHDQTVKVRVKNESKFLITKLIFLDTTLTDIKPRQYSNYFDVPPFYPSSKIDITLERKRMLGRDLWYRLISYPIDHRGDKKITNEKSTLILDIIKSEEKGQVELDANLVPD